MNCLVKGLIAVVVLVLLLWGGLMLLGKLAASSFDDTSALTHRLRAHVVDADPHRSSLSKPGYNIVYRYTFGGTAWRDDGYVLRETWKPGQKLIICVDPDHPSHHAVREVYGSKCGDENVSSGVHTATPHTR